MPDFEALWPNVRATLIAAFACVCVLEGCPTPRTSHAILASAVNQAELETWCGILGRLGIETTPRQLGDALVSLTDAVNARKRALLAPFQPLFDAFGISQRWSLFPVADTHPPWMHVEARCGGGDFELVYRPNDPAADWNAAILEYRRVRATWNPSIRGPRAAFPAFVDWVARRLLQERPDCDAVRVRFLQLRLPAPGETEFGRGNFVWSTQRTRAQVGL